MMEQLFTVDGELNSAPGGRARGYLVADTSAAGTLIRIPVQLVHGAYEGPTLLVASGIHGDDLNTVPMVWRLLAEVDPTTLKGRLIGLPVCNPLAFEAGSHFTPADNKSPRFPGNPHGTVSERLGHQLYRRVVRHADYVVDMHGGSRNATLAVLAHVDGTAADDVLATAHGMAAAFGPQLVVVSQPKGDAYGLHQIASRDGKPGIYVGMGKMGFNETDTIRGVAGMRNVLRYLGMIDEPVRDYPAPALTISERYLNTPYGGAFAPQVAAGATVAEGDILGVVSDMFGRVYGEITTPVAGIVDAIRAYPIVSAGDWVASVAPWQ